VGKRSRKRGRGPSGKSVAVGVYDDAVRRHEAALVELAEARVRMETLENLLIAAVVTNGSPLQVNYPPPGSRLELAAHERDGGVLLFVTDLNEAGDGQEGKDDADEDRMDRRGLESNDGLQRRRDQPGL
jgi:hypothetical protein